MNSKRIGNIGEVKALCKFVEMGIPCYIPYGDNEKSDLIAEFNGGLKRIQIKTSYKCGNEKIIFSINSSSYHRGGTNHFYTKEEVDYFVLYNIESDKIFLVPIERCFANNQFTIRLKKAKNGQIKNINFYEDFSFENMIS